MRSPFLSARGAFDTGHLVLRASGAIGKMKVTENEVVTALRIIAKDGRL
jgi:hypothetical protein